MTLLPFKIDAHVHTCETSQCAKSSGAAIAQRYHQMGYHGIVITDHIHDGYIHQLENSENWQACVDSFLLGYQAAKATGDKLDLAVILGAELRLENDTSDFLIYGIDEDFLRRNPYLHRHTIEDFYHKFSQQVLIIQAHPFRRGNHPVNPQHMHGVEVENGSPFIENNNHLTAAFVQAHPHLCTTKGSDTHHVDGAGLAHMAFTKPITNAKEFMYAVKPS